MSNPPKKPPLLVMKDINKWYGKGQARHHVLKGVDLTVEQGEFISLIGTSGSGKTTMLNIIGMLDSRYVGQVEVRGENIQELNDKKLSRLRNETMGFVFQAFNLLPHMSCVENVMMPAHFCSDKQALKAEGLERAQKLLTELGLEDKFDEPPTHLSGGQKQRVAIARALFNHPRLILCDEPTGSLDSETGRQILALFRKQNKEEGISFIIVTHDENISRNCDRIVRVSDGLIVSDEANRPRDDLLVGGSDVDHRPERLPVPSLVPAPDNALEFQFEAQIGELEPHTSSPVLEGDLGIQITPESVVWEARTDTAKAPEHRWLMGEDGGGEVSLEEPFYCHLSQSKDGEQALLHLTLRQQHAQAGWLTLGLSAATSSGREQLAELPEKPEHYPLTDEASLRRFLAVLRGAMHRHGRERWL